jgi:DnaA family protein
VSQLPLALQLRAQARFETFVPGRNAAVLEHVEALAAGRAEEALWVSGRLGSGKSHLLQAACAAAHDLGLRAMYFSPRAFEQARPELLLGLESVEFLALDDLDVIVGGPAWERVLFGLFEASARREQRLLIAATARPQALSFSLRDLASRAAGAVLYRLQPLGEEDQLLALRRHARHRGLELDEAAGLYLLRRVERDMPALCGWLEKLDEASLVAQRKLTVPFIRATLEGPSRP